MVLLGSSGSSNRRSASGLAAADPEALIEEARRRTRRRRRRVLLIAVVVIVAGVAAVLSSGGAGGGSRVVAESGSTPFANVRAFSGQGQLAFVSRGVLWVMDGATGSLRRPPVSAGFTPYSPTFSHDGRWLAYVAERNGSTELWLAHGDGGDARRVAAPNIYQIVGWSPTADALALTIYRQEPFAPYPAVTRLELISPPSSNRTLVDLSPTRARPDSIWSAVWSPDGRQIAVSTVGSLTSVRTYPVAGRAPTNWFAIGKDQPFPVHICSGCGHAEAAIADLVGWWPRWGIGFWVYCCGAVRNNDATPIVLVARPGARPYVLTRTLSSGATDAVAAAPNGALAVVATTSNAGRELGAGKTVETCDPATCNCNPVPGATTWIGPDHQRCVIPTQSAQHCLGYTVPPAGQPGSGVSLDPAWSPNAALLAYVRAPIALTAGNPDPAWYAAHVIYVWNPRTAATHRVGEVDGSSVPTWSRDGRDLLYERNDGLWLAPVSGGTPTRIAYPLLTASQLYGFSTVNYYGQIPWTAQFAWSSP